jgi:GxxExxY protein
MRRRARAALARVPALRGFSIALTMQEASGSRSTGASWQPLARRSSGRRYLREIREISMGDMEMGMAFDSYRADKFTDRIIGCIIKVHQTLGPGFLENVYRRAMILELREQGFVTEVEKEVNVYYGGQEVGRHRLDLLVDGQMILEIKAVEGLNRIHYAQIRSYLKSTGLGLGLLVNFAGERADFRRIEIQ